MTLTIEAVYENGSLKLDQPLPFAEHEKVRVTVERVPQAAALQVDEAKQAVRSSYGLIGWTGDADTLDRLLAELEEAEELP